MIWPLTCVLVTGLAGLTLYFGGLAGALYGALYSLTLVTALPLGWWLFGRQTPLGWVAGAIVGYACSALAFWLPAWLGFAHPLTFLVAWLVPAVAIWRWRPDREGPLLPLPAWGRRDTVRWLALLTLVLAFVAIPFSRVGQPDESGARRYRAYFTADFVWHMALTEELARFEFPPTNPYLTPEPIHYYWTYFMVPAALAGRESARLVPIEAALKIGAVTMALLMFSVVFLGAWSVTGRSRAALAASVLALMAPSWEGSYSIYGLWDRGLGPAAIFEELRGLNIDAVTNWRFQGLRIDGLIRSMWWTPQHATSFALGLIALLAAARAGGNPSRALLTLIGLALALSVAMNPFLGAAFCVVHALVMVTRVLVGATGWRGLLSQVFVIGPVAAALGWTAVNQMGDGAGTAITLGWQGLGRRAPVTTMVLSLGGLFVPAALCLWPWKTRRLGPAAAAIPAVLVALGLGWFVSLTDVAWVGFRAGNLLQVALPMLAASGLAALADASRVAAAALTVALIAVGAPTTVIDTFNAQDLENRAMGPGFYWVIPISQAQQAGFRWLRENTDPNAVVQADPVARGRNNWSLVPTFGARRMAAGLPISLLSTPAYTERSETVHQLLTLLDLQAAHARAKELNIDYVWLDEDDPPDVAQRLGARPDLFALAFQQTTVRIFEVQ